MLEVIPHCCPFYGIKDYLAKILTSCFMERIRLVKIIKRLEPGYIDVINFEEFSFNELKLLYIKLVKDNRNLGRSKHEQ